MEILLALVILATVFGIWFVVSRSVEPERADLLVAPDRPDDRDPYRERFHEKAVKEAEQAANRESTSQEPRGSTPQSMDGRCGTSQSAEPSVVPDKTNHRDPYRERFHEKAVEEAKQIVHRESGHGEPRDSTPQAKDGRSIEAGGIKWHVSIEMSSPPLGPEGSRAYEEAVNAERHPGLWRVQLAGHTHETRVGNIARKSIYKALQPGQRLRMVREPANPYDFQCVSLWLDPPVGPALDVGFIPRAWVLTFAGLMDRRAEFEASVYEVKRQGQHGEYLCLIAEIRQTKEPELKRRPRRETILRAYEKSGQILPT